MSLQGGLICSYLNGYCIDSMYGETVWDYIPTKSCDDTLSLLYEGEAEIVAYRKHEKYVVVEIKALARTTLEYIWGWFTDLGIFMSGMIFFVILKIFKYLIEVTG